MYVFRIHMAVNNIQFTKIEIQIAKYLFKHYKDRYNARQLASKFMEYVLSLEEKEFPKWLSVLSHSLKKFKDCIEMGLAFGSSIKTKDFNDMDVLLMYDAKKSKDIKKIKDEIRKSELVEKPIRYVDIAEKDILLNKEDKIFYNILSESLVFHNPEKYVEVVRKCRKLTSI